MEIIHRNSMITTILVIVFSLILSACATSQPPQPDATTAAEDAAVTETVSSTDTPIPPTDTPVPPTDTPIPPTDTPVPTDIPLPTDTPVPKSTDTPVLPASTPTPNSTHKVTPAPYDDFEDPQYEFSFDTSHFSSTPGFPEDCDISQENGILKIHKLDSEGFANCSLMVDKPISVKSTSLEEMHINALLESDHNGGEAFSALAADTRFDDIGVAWIAECGIWGFDDGPHAVFIIRHIQSDQKTDIAHFSESPLEYDIWYQFTLKSNQDTFELGCSVEGELLEVYNLKSDQYYDRIANLRFLRWIEAVYLDGSLATFLLDDFYMFPSQ